MRFAPDENAARGFPGVAVTIRIIRGAQALESMVGDPGRRLGGLRPDSPFSEIPNPQVLNSPRGRNLCENGSRGGNFLPVQPHPKRGWACQSKVGGGVGGPGARFPSSQLWLSAGVGGAGAQDQCEDAGGGCLRTHGAKQLRSWGGGGRGVSACGNLTPGSSR